MTLSPSSARLARQVAWPQATAFPCSEGAVGSPDHVCAAVLGSVLPTGRSAPGVFPIPWRGGLGGDFVPAVTMLSGTRTHGTETAPVLLQLPVSCYGLQK